MLFKFYKWYQITQRIKNVFEDHVSTVLGAIHLKMQSFAGTFQIFYLKFKNCQYNFLKTLNYLKSMSC